MMKNTTNDELYIVVTDESTEPPTTSEWSTDCAWCLVEQGSELGEGSHGICSPHAEAVYASYQARHGRAA